jgi:methionyl-tRNA synthetase
VHGFLLLDDRKISKTLGNVIDPLDLIDVYGADPVRFWCARAVSFGQDGSASIEGLHERYERELGNDLGNLLSRTTAMIARYLGGDLPARASEASEIRALVQGLGDDVAASLDTYDITGGLDRIWKVVRRLNAFVGEQAPWRLAEDPGNQERVEAVLYDVADGLRVVAVALAAYLPETSPRILESLGEDPLDLDWSRVAYGLTTTRGGIVAASPLYPRVEAPTTSA